MVSQQDGFGSVVSFELESTELVEPFTRSLRNICLAESLGGVESLVCHPATMTHASMDEATQTAAGIRDTLLRLSVGIEDPRDLADDVERSLNAAVAATRVSVGSRP